MLIRGGKANLRKQLRELGRTASEPVKEPKLVPEVRHQAIQAAFGLNEAELIGIHSQSKYDPSHDKRAFRLMLLGHTEEELAVAFGVTAGTILEWKKKYASFAVHINQGKDEADSFVAESLFLKACGYSHPDEIVKVYRRAVKEKDGDGKEKVVGYENEVVRIPVMKHYPPDTLAGIYILNNRHKRNWGQAQKHEITGADGGPIVISALTIDVSDLSMEELGIAAKLGLKFREARQKLIEDQRNEVIDLGDPREVLQPAVIERGT